ncbi:MAG: hypothetical protein GY821_02830 [Gammaproteobacteria bacterium]|nr:hypothetical protein [Gammaproteobacteria bacterium]
MMAKPLYPVENVSLDAITQAMQTWRENKEPGKRSVIPDELWCKIFTLAQSHDAKIIRGLLSISKEQYDNKYRQLIVDERPVNRELPVSLR